MPNTKYVDHKKILEKQIDNKKITEQIVILNIFNMS